MQSSEEEALQLEMERISLDWVMIQNPTSEDFYIEWYNTKGTPWKYLVPKKTDDIGYGKGQREVQRYLAVWYCKHMAEKIINERGQAEGEKMLKERADKGQPVLTKFEEQKAIWEKTPRTNSNEELANLYPNLFLGVTREFGTEYQPDQVMQPNDKSVQEIAMEKLQSRKYTPNPAVKEVVAPKQSLESVEALLPPVNKEELLKEISAE